MTSGWNRGSLTGQIIAAEVVVQGDTATIRVHAEQVTGVHLRQCEPAAQRQRPRRCQAPFGVDDGARRRRYERAAGSVACGSTDCDAESLEEVLAGVSDRLECVRGEGEWQSSGCP